MEIVLGVFNFLKKKDDNNKSGGMAFASIQTVQTDVGLFSAYEEIFFREMGAIKTFSKKELKSMYEVISCGEGGHLNQGRYYAIIFARYFKDKEWVWPEFEKWRSLFLEHREWPVSWRRLKPWCLTDEMEIKDILVTLKVSELKELVENLEVKFESRSNKISMMELVLRQPFLAASLASIPVWSRALDNCSVRKRSELYALLMRTIDFRATCLNDRKRQSKLGIKERKLCICFEEDKKFIDIALAENSNGLTPLFPGDHSFWRAIVPGLE